MIFSSLFPKIISSVKRCFDNRYFLFKRICVFPDVIDSSGTSPFSVRPILFSRLIILMVPLPLLLCPSSLLSRNLLTPSWREKTVAIISLVQSPEICPLCRSNNFSRRHFVSSVDSFLFPSYIVLPNVKNVNCISPIPSFLRNW